MPNRPQGRDTPSRSASVGKLNALTEVDEDALIVADGPGIVTGLDDHHRAGPALRFGPVIHHHMQPARLDEQRVRRRVVIEGPLALVMTIRVQIRDQTAVGGQQKADLSSDRADNETWYRIPDSW